MAGYIVSRGWVADRLYGENTQGFAQRVVVEDGPRWTGLIDEYGNQIMRVPDPIGFGHHGQ